MQEGNSPTPERFWQLLSGFQLTAALKAAIDIGLFTAIAEGSNTPAKIGVAAGAAERGVRILCDTLTVVGLLKKDAGVYSLTEEAAMFLVKTSPAYLGTVADFILAPQQVSGFANLTEAVRNGGAAADTNFSLDPESPMWANFARSMAPMMMPAAMTMAGSLGLENDAAIKVLDIAAGHGMFGITAAMNYPNAEIFALDWANVLAVAEENAAKFGVADRYHKIEGSAFDVDLGSGYDVILVTNFLHHFDKPTNEAFLKRCCDALNDDGQLLTLEFVPNDDRVSPPGEALFSLVMLAATPAGDAYTFAELDSMLKNAGFANNAHRPMTGTPQHWIASRKA
jgi:ubiquinone/menaquinone biosynthesis C-methylase UbiE